MQGFKLKAGEKLTDTQMARIPSMFAKLEPDFDVRSIINDKQYENSEGKSFLGKDLKALIALMYNKPRTAYWNSSRAQIHDTSFCSGVPLPLLGFKRFRGMTYNDFKLSSSCFEDTGEIFNIKIRPDCVEKLWHLDQLLGYSLASTSVEQHIGTYSVETTPLYGLGMLCALPADLPWTGKVIRILREHGIGNRRGSFASTFGASEVQFNDIKEDLLDTEKDFIRLYNNCNQTVRHLLTQRWAWYGNHRNTDMICDFRDWNNVPKSVDSDFEGLKPKEVITSSLEMYGL
jgi:hypothetical protein